MIIALNGKKGSGKDTMANYMCEKFGFVNYGFADPIKDVGRILFDFTDEQLDGCFKEVEDKFWGIAPRDFFQKFGTDIAQFEFPKYFPGLFRKHDSRAIWVRIFDFWYSKKLRENPNLKVVISDLRFKHEYEYLKKMDAYFIRIKSHRNMGENFASHISETELDDIEFNNEVENNGTIEEFYEKIDGLLK